MDFRRFIGLVFILCCSSVAQVQTMDNQLLEKLKTARLPSEKAQVYYQAGDALAIYDTLQAVSYIRQGLTLVGDDSFYQGMGYFYLGRVYMEFSPAKATSAFDTAILHFQQTGTPESYIYQSRTWANKAVMAQLKSDNKTYIDVFLKKVIPLAAQGGDSLRVADGYTHVSLPFMNYGEYGKAIFYLKKSAAIFQRRAPKDLRLVDVYCYLAKIYLLESKTDEAGRNIQAAGKILMEDPESVFAPNFHAMEAMYLIKLKQWNAAAQTIEKGLNIAEKLRNRYDIRQLLYQKSELFKAQRNWKQEKAVLLRMYHEGYIELMTDKRQLFSDLSKLEEQLGNYRQAYVWLLKHKEVSEEIYAQETNAKIADLEAKYNYVQKEKELILTREKAKRQQVMVWITIFVFALTIVLFYVWFRNRKLRTGQEIQNLKQQQRIELGKALLEGEEKERSRLARDLHDGLGGMLAGIKLNLSQMATSTQPVAPDELKQTVDRLGYSVNELRQISRNMMPESLLQSGLEVALKDLCDEAALSGVKVSFGAFDLHENFSPQVKVMIYRIIQELLYNAVKHAEASKIMVQCSQSDNFFFITVEDDGTGFVVEDIPNTSRGLKNIQNRLDLLNGRMEIETSSEGTNINIEVYVGQ